jgi:hypothetical protein
MLAAAATADSEGGARFSFKSVQHRTSASLHAAPEGRKDSQRQVPRNFDDVIDAGQRVCRER